MMILGFKTMNTYSQQEFMYGFIPNERILKIKQVLFDFGSLNNERFNMQIKSCSSEVSLNVYLCLQ